jgi:hypothetical protein
VKKPYFRVRHPDTEDEGLTSEMRVGQSGRSYMYVKGKEPYRQISVYAGEDGGPATAHYATTEPEPEF